MYKDHLLIESGYFPVDEIHSLYYEIVGNPNGIPLLFLHGGPGDGFSDSNKRFFNPKKYKIILFDQRGCGRSRPFGELDNNTTPLLISDIKKLKEKLNIEKWLVFGLSWGSTLALYYSIKYPQDVMHLIVGGIFLANKLDYEWTYGENGVSNIVSDSYQQLTDYIPNNEKHNLPQAYYNRFLNGDNKKEAYFRWSSFIVSTLTIHPFEVLKKDITDEMITNGLIELFYTKNAYFIEENFILKNIKAIEEIPCDIIHGRFDLCCRFQNAYKLHKNLPISNLHCIQNAGHWSKEKDLETKIIEICDNINLN